MEKIIQTASKILTTESVIMRLIHKLYKCEIYVLLSLK